MVFSSKNRLPSVFSNLPSSSAFNFINNKNNCVYCQSTRGSSSSKEGDDDFGRTISRARSRTAGRNGRLRGWNAAFGMNGGSGALNYLAPFQNIGNEDGSVGMGSPRNHAGGSQTNTGGQSNIPVQALSGGPAYNYARLGLCTMSGNVFSEDRFAFDEVFLNGNSLFLLSVFDGHGGWQIAHYLEQELLPTIKKELFSRESNSSSDSDSITTESNNVQSQESDPITGEPLTDNTNPPVVNLKRDGSSFPNTTGSGVNGKTNRGSGVNGGGKTIEPFNGNGGKETLIPCTTDIKEVQAALINSYKKVDMDLRNKVKSSIRLGFDRFVRVGSCACTVAVVDSHYVVANSGDCRALLCQKGGKPLKLSRVHNADEKTERDRIRKDYPDDPDAVVCHLQGWLDPKTGDLYENFRKGREFYEVGCYMKGVLQPTRAFGDFALKDPELNVQFPKNNCNGGNRKNSDFGENLHNKFAVDLVQQADFSKGPYLSATPEISILPRSETDELLVLGSDGLFDYLSEEEICDVARSAASPEIAAGALVDAVKCRALSDNGIKEREYEQLPAHKKRDIHDDVTVCVFYLQFPEPWRKRFHELSDRLQILCDDLIKENSEIAEKFGVNGSSKSGGLDFSVCIADPSLGDCPLVAVSKGFETLTGYQCEDAIGRNCRFLCYGVPNELRKKDEETTARLRKFTDVAISGDPFAVFGDQYNNNDLHQRDNNNWMPEDLRRLGGGGFFLRWNRRKNGELFRNLFVLRQVWVGDRTYLVALQSEIIPQETTTELSKEMILEIGHLADIVSQEVEEVLPTLAKTEESSWEANRKLAEAMRRFRENSD